MAGQETDESQTDSQDSSAQSSENSESKENTKSVEKKETKDDTFSREYVESLRRENAKYRTESKQVKEELHKTLIRSELKTAALSAGIVDLDALRMFDTSKLSISADGDVVGVSELITDMCERKAYLFKQKQDKSETDASTDSKTETKSKTSSSAKSPEKTAAKPPSAMEMSKEDFDKLKRAGYKALEKLA